MNIVLNNRKGVIFLGMSSGNSNELFDIMFTKGELIRPQPESLCVRLPASQPGQHA